MKTLLRAGIVLLVLAGSIAWQHTHAQCIGVPAVSSLGSNKFPLGLCAPVESNVTYTVGFAAPMPAGTLEVVYDWGDGTTPEVIALETGKRNYHLSRSHTYPVESDCEYTVTMAVRFNGITCTNTFQIQKISSWRTDEFNGGKVRLISPASKQETHLVCEGENIGVIFNDHTNWNCNTALASGEDAIESPNTEDRWQQIIYNAASTGRKIPNVSVNGVPVTGAGGADIKADYHDPRGVWHMAAPVVVNDPRRRPTLEVTAPGGFGPTFPKAGDVFAITLRYWNFCNPYDDPNIAGPPADILNGDHPPVERTAFIRVIAPPPALKGSEASTCVGHAPPPFTVTGETPGNTIHWYRYVEGSEAPGALITSGTSTSLPVSAHPDWKGKKTAAAMKVWATQRATNSEAGSCESPKVLVTRTIRPALEIPVPLTAVPEQVCNGASFAINFPESNNGEALKTRYVWTTSPGLKLVETRASSATFTAEVQDFGTALYLDRTVQVNREYASAPSCAETMSYTVRIYAAPAGGIISGATQTCESASVDTLSIAGHRGDILRWEVSHNNGAWATYEGPITPNGIMPGSLPPGSYAYRAVVANGPCQETNSATHRVEVSASAGAADAGPDQFICNALSSAALGATRPATGTGVWTYVSSVPAKLPPPAFNAADANTRVVITSEHAGVYTMRWTVSNGACSSFDEVVVDFGLDPTTPDAGRDRLVCGTATVLTGNTPQKGSGRWSVVSGPSCSGGSCNVTIPSPAAADSRVELTGSTPVYGAYTFRWSISSGGNNCFLKTDEVTITFQEPVAVAADDIAGICLDRDNLAPIELSGVVSGAAHSLTWRNLSGTGTVSATSSEMVNGVRTASASYQPSAADYDADLPIRLALVATASSTACGPAADTVSVHFNRVPIASAGVGAANICGDAFQLSATPLLKGETGRWSTSQPEVAFEDPSDPVTTVRNLPTGSTTIVWTVTSAEGGCTSRPSAIVLSRVSVPHVTDFTATACEVTPSTTEALLVSYEDKLTTLEPEHRVVTWLKQMATGEESVAEPEVVQQEVSDGQVFIARIADRRTGCSSDAHVTVRVRALPPVINAVVTHCEETPASGLISGVDLGEAQYVSAITPAPDARVTWYTTEADARAEQSAITTPVLINRQKEFHARVSYNDAPYCASFARLNIVVTPQPAVTSIAGREAVCQGVSSSFSNDLPVQVYQVTPIPGAKYFWNIPDDPETQFKVFGGGGERDFYVLLQFPNVYTGAISVRAELNGCSGPVVEKQISVSASPAMPVIYGPAVVCENAGQVPFRVSPDNAPASAYNWEVRRPDGTIARDAFIAEGQLTGNVLVNFGKEDVVISVRESNAECASPVASRTVKVTGAPRADLLVENEISCFAAADGVIRASVSGGTAPYSAFQILQTGATDENKDGVFEGLGPGTYTVRVSDANGCVATTETKTLVQPDPVEVSFSMTGPENRCGGGTFGFTWEAEAGIDYRWEWGDGTTTAIAGADVHAGENRISHTFKAASSVAATEFAVMLFARDGACPEQMATHRLTVFPEVRLNITPSDTVVCGGETVTFFNSAGTLQGKWYARSEADGQLLEPVGRDGNNVAFTFANDGDANPLAYEVVYEAENSWGCPATYRQTVRVYRFNNASFKVGAVPSFTIGAVQVNVENTSDVRSSSDYEYNWTYGEHGTTKAVPAAAPFDISYHSPGAKEISLSIVNRAAREAGTHCQSSFRAQITIPVAQLAAAFKATPSAACYPVTVEVENSTRGADTFSWKLYREGVLVTTSNLMHPGFRITAPGIYDITLSASVASTGQTSEASVSGIRIFDVPHASFEPRSTLIYVPDTPLELMNFSTEATGYTWDFGDGATSDAFEPAHAYARSGDYSVSLVAYRDHGAADTDSDGVADMRVVCYDSARRQVKALEGGDLTIPNAFTPDTGGPNGGRPPTGGFNDVFLPEVRGARAFHMQIYDRWGSMVFESRDADTGWDGYDGDSKLMPAGVYIYKITVVKSDGETLTRAGDLTLIR